MIMTSVKIIIFDGDIYYAEVVAVCAYIRYNAVRKSRTRYIQLQ